MRRSTLGTVVTVAGLAIRAGVRTGTLVLTLPAIMLPLNSLVLLTHTFPQYNSNNL
jgi:hypothetical protein